MVEVVVGVGFLLLIFLLFFPLEYSQRLLLWFFSTSWVWTLVSFVSCDRAVVVSFGFALLFLRSIGFIR